MGGIGNESSNKVTNRLPVNDFPGLFGLRPNE